MKLSRIAIVGLICLGWGIRAHADPVLWTFDSVTFTDGGTATGSFVWDNDTLVASDIMFTTTRARRTQARATGSTLLAPAGPTFFPARAPITRATIS